MTSLRLSIGSLVCASLFLAPSTASAWVVLDPSNLAQNVISVAQGVQSLILQNAMWLKEYMLDVVQKGIATNIEERILDSAMRWAQTGFNGDPSFVINPKDLVLDTEWNEAELFMDQLNGVITSVCSPYRVSALNKVTIAAQDRRSNTNRDISELQRLTRCDLDQAVTSGVIENYYAPGGFEREGGFAPLIRTMSQRRNNPYEIEEVLKEIQSGRQAQAVAEAQSETFGGTQPNKVCIVPGPNGSCIRAENRTPASNVSDFISKAIGHSLDEISGQDEILESIFAGIVRRFSEDIVNRGLR